MPLTPKQQERLVSLGAHIKAIREEKGLTLKELAYRIDKDPQSINRLELGGVNPSLLYLEQICEGLEIDLKQLLSRPDAT